jgi:DNA-binding NarL/FixJ family response regulator
MITIALVTTDRDSGRRVLAALRMTNGCTVTCLDGSRPFANAIAMARPDVVVVDTGSADEPLPADAHELRAAVPSAKLVLLAARLDHASLAAAAVSGIDVALSRHTDPTSIGILVREIGAGHVHPVAPATRGAAARPRHGLSARELQVLRMAAGGTSNACIARTLWITDGTVKYHLSNIFRKLGVANRTEASHYAHFHRLFEHGAPSAGLKEEAA